MSDPIGTYNLPQLSRGDTFRGRNIAAITLQSDGSAIALTGAWMELRTRAGALVHRWETDGSANATITGVDSNTVTLDAVPPATTAAWPTGALVYDLEVEFASDSAKLTIMKGTLEVRADTTQPATA